MGSGLANRDSAGVALLARPRHTLFSPGVDPTCFYLDHSAGALQAHVRRCSCWGVIAEVLQKIGWFVPEHAMLMRPSVGLLSISGASSHSRDSFLSDGYISMKTLMPVR